jgi:hypothetical protein
VVKFKFLSLFFLALLQGCNSSSSNQVSDTDHLPASVGESRKLSIKGFKDVTLTSIKNRPYEQMVTFDPFIPRDDTALTYALLEVGQLGYGLSSQPAPEISIVDTKYNAKGFRIKYPHRALVFVTVKNDDGTIHSAMVLEE